MNSMLHKIALPGILLACLMQCRVTLGAGLPEHIEKVGDHAYLVDSGDDILVAHAVLTLPPYNADPMGIRDSTRAFRQAIDVVSEMGGGLVYVPAGVYKVQGTIQLKQDKVVIQGRHAGGAAAAPTVLLAYEGKGSEEGKPFITISGRSCGLKDLAVFYPEQGEDEFLPFPYTIHSGPSAMLENVTLYNAYNGIRFDVISGSLLENIRMCALKNGITAKWSSEFGWSRNIEISAKVWQELPAFLRAQKPSRDAVRSFMKENCTGMELGALDGFIVDGLAASDCKTALWAWKDLDFIKTHRNGAEVKRVNDSFGLGAILSGIEGRIEYNGHDYYYFGIPAVSLDNIRGLPELRRDWPSHRRAAKASPADFFNVMRTGARGDGQADDTPAVLQALKQVSANGGGIVYFPQGKYRITKPLSVPAGTELRGACARQELRLSGSEVTSLLFELEAKSGDPAEAPASITLAENAGIRGLNVLFPQQWQHLSEEGFTPVPAPYAVRGRGPGVYLIDCVITPAWQMVDFASFPCDNFMIKRVAGWGMKAGINIGGGTKGGTIEFTQVTYGLTLGTDRNPLLKVKDGWNKSFGILSDYSGKHSISYLFGDASDIDSYGLQAFHPLRHIEIYRQNGRSLRDSRFHYPLLDVSMEQSLVLDGASNLDFYGYWVTGRHREFNWVKGTDIESIRVFAPGIHPPYHRGNYEASVPLDGFEMIPETTLSPDTRIVEGGAEVRNVLDGNLKTYWKAPLKEAKFVLDLGQAMTVHRYTLVDGHLIDFKDTTAIKSYRISVSLNNTDWRPLEIPKRNVLDIQFRNPKKYVVLDQPVTPARARYVKLEILDVWERRPRGRRAVDTRSAIVRMFDVRTEPLEEDDK